MSNFENRVVHCATLVNRASQPPGDITILMEHPMKFLSITATAMTALLSTGALAEDKRGADAHQHGHGALYLALEGETLAIEMETPGADILGFEHAAKAAEDKATVEKARKILNDPATLFGLSGAAGCTLTDADIEIGADEEHADDHSGEDHRGDDHDKHADDEHGHDEHSDEDHDKHADDDHGHDDHADEETSHSEVHAQYTLTCGAPSKITGLDLTEFFAAFPNAEELDAAILTDDGQASGEITADSPKLTF